MSDARSGSERASVLVELPAYSDLFAGRDAERAAVGELLCAGQARLVTLTGPPGIGKTRLAIACAGDFAAGAAVGACYVDLVPVRDPDLVLAEVAGALGVQPRGGGDLVGQLTTVLGSTPLLLLIDNCEHVLAAAPRLGQLIAACPGLRILATSRERLRIGGEQEFPVPPLRMPAVRDAANLDTLADNPSVAVLVDRARRASPGFSLTATNAGALIEASVRLEGLPLALELAAARLKVLTPAELVFRLDKRMELLAGTARDVPPRQRALRAAIAWSHDLLTEQERSLFRRLSIFLGNWTTTDAQAVCAAESTALLDHLESLLEKSLIRRVSSDAERAEFSMLESLRQFAAEQLAARGETDEIRNRHAMYFAELAVRLESALGSPEEQAVWWSGSSAHHADQVAALEHCVATGRRDAALGLVAVLGWYAYTRGDVGTGLARVEKTLAWAQAQRADDDGADPNLPSALVAGGILAWTAGKLERAETLLAEALRISESTGDLRHSSVARAFLGHVARLGGRYDESAAWHDRAAEGFAALGNRLGATWARHDMGLLARDRGDLDRAVELLRRAVRDFRDLDAPWAVAWAATVLGTALCARGDADQAAAVLGEALDTFRVLDDFRGIAQCFETLARVACELAAYEAAARLVGAAAAVRLRLGMPPAESDLARIGAVDATLDAALGANSADHFRQSGRTMPLSRAADLAATVAAGRSPADPHRPVTATLTRRERQVAALVASGRTNRQIGKALGIAEKTAEVHLQHAMGKLGARSRAEVAAWAVANDMLAAARD